MKLSEWCAAPAAETRATRDEERENGHERFESPPLALLVLVAFMNFFRTGVLGHILECASLLLIAPPKQNTNTESKELATITINRRAADVVAPIS